MSIIELNKLIAEFMGAKMIVTDYHGINIIQFPDDKTFDLLGLKYHSSWEWLMKVVEKIETKYNYTIYIYSNNDNSNSLLDKFRCSIFNNEHKDIIYNTNNLKIKCVYDSIVEFIKWYNEKERGKQ